MGLPRETDRQVRDPLARAAAAAPCRALVPPHLVRHVVLPVARYVYLAQPIRGLTLGLTELRDSQCRMHPPPPLLVCARFLTAARACGRTMCGGVQERRRARPSPTTRSRSTTYTHPPTPRASNPGLESPPSLPLSRSHSRVLVPYVSLFACEPSTRPSRARSSTRVRCSAATPCTRPLIGSATGSVRVHTGRVLPGARPTSHSLARHTI